MQSASAALIVACNAAGQRPIVYVEFSWARTGSILAARGGTGWTDETARLERDRAQLAINPPGERLVAAGQVGAATVTLDNTTQRYSWRNPAAALYAQIGEANSPAGPVGVPARIWRGYVTTSGPEYLCVFTGVVAGWNERPDGAVDFALRDWGWVYQQNKLSLAAAANQLPSAWIATVAAAGGIAANEMVLDVGILPIGYVWMDKESVVEEIWLAAEADGGLALFNQTGKLLYWNPLHWIGQAAVWTFGEGSYTLSEPETDASNVATEITVEWSPRVVGVAADVYTLEKPRDLMPGETAAWFARFTHAALEVFAPDLDQDDYFAASLGGADLSAELDVTLTAVYGQGAEVEVVNNSTSQSARLSWLRLRGRPLLGGPSEEVTVQASPAPLPFPRSRALRSNTSAGQGPWTDSVQGNVYMQSREQGAALAELLAIRCRRVRAIWTLSDAPGVPQLELGDRVVFYDTRSLGTGQAVQGLVIGISWEGGASGYMQQIRLMDVSDLAEYDNYFIIGTSVLGGQAGDGHGRLWY